MKERGFQIKLTRRTVEEKAQGLLAARNRTAMVLIDDVFYGRPIVKMPRSVLLHHESWVLDEALRQELAEFLFEGRAARAYSLTSEESTHLLSLSYALIAVSRDADSVFRSWIEAVRCERVPVLELTDLQRRVLQGTTVEPAFNEMARNRDLIEQTASNFTFFQRQPVTREEASWALAVIMRHARVVHPHQDVRDSRMARMYLLPVAELLDVALHPDPGVAITFQEEITLETGRVEEEMVLQIARRDMAKGEEVFSWTGRLSNSDMVVRHGMTFPYNPVGIGSNVTEPPGWSEDTGNNYRKEYERYNCSSLESFELRLTPRGHPARGYVRCYRVSWFLAHGWYSPAFRSRLRELDRWPPPEKYSKDDWLSWTQADQALNNVILSYCQAMRQRLKDTMDGATAEQFRKSRDHMDRLLWQLRSEESKTFKACIKVAKRVHY